MVIGVFFGVVLGTYIKRGFSKIEAFFDSFTVIPTVMIAYFFFNLQIHLEAERRQQPF